MQRTYTIWDDEQWVEHTFTFTHVSAVRATDTDDGRDRRLAFETPDGRALPPIYATQLCGVFRYPCRHPDHEPNNDTVLTVYIFAHADDPNRTFNLSFGPTFYGGTPLSIDTVPYNVWYHEVDFILPPNYDDEVKADCLLFYGWLPLHDVIQPEANNNAHSCDVCPRFHIQWTFPGVHPISSTRSTNYEDTLRTLQHSQAEFQASFGAQRPHYPAP